MFAEFRENIYMEKFLGVALYEGDYLNWKIIILAWLYLGGDLAKFTRT